MRLSRNRHWGTPELVSYLEKFATDARRYDGWPGLLVGDMSQPRGGPMRTGHASHQVGLDVDIWFDKMPNRRLTAEEREKKGATSLTKPKTHFDLEPANWPANLEKLLKRAASYPEVERIFVNPGIKKRLCDTVGPDRAWLSKLRPYYLHNDHFHVRLRCPAGAKDCIAQAKPAADDGCGKDLDYWLSGKPWEPPPKPVKPVKPVKPKPPLTLAGLPKACIGVLYAKDAPDKTD
jgi:penicillin-insensitive murein endopeptidase